MPAISVIIPVYNVEAYLRECLNSVVRATTDFEVIVVDDCSPDNSAAIVAEIASTDDRVRYVRNETNIGLGPSRNIGLQHASGDYIIFLDSDDSMTPGSLESIASLASATQADLIVFDYQRLYWNNKTERNATAHILQNCAKATTLTERPELLQVLNVAWNKAYRREFIEESSIRFPPGYYEDIPFTYPVLALADSIVLHDRVCINYRQRRQGSILRSTSSRHFEMFEQIDRLFEVVCEHSILEQWRSAFWERCAAHVEAILAKGSGRIEPGERRAFFELASSTLNRHLPAEHQLPPGPRGLKIRLILRNQYTAFSTLKLGKRTQRATRSASRKLEKQVRKKGLDQFHRVSRHLPIEPQLAVFSSLWNRPPSGNPLAIYNMALAAAPDIRSVWVVDQKYRYLVPDHVETVLPGSKAFHFLIARAKYFVNDVNFPTWWNKRNEQVFLQTQHGTPLKYMGMDLQRYPRAAAGMSFRLLMNRVDNWDFNLSSNRYSTEVWKRAFPSNYETLEYGYPRNDVLVNAQQTALSSARSRIGISEHRRVVLYMPTFRDGASSFQPSLDLPRLVSLVGDETTLVIRGHYFHEASEQIAELQRAGILLDATGYANVEDLYLASDLLVTDYSSAMFDFANLGRPIIIYANDWDEYRRNRGAYFDITRDAPGHVVTSVNDLARILNSDLESDEIAINRLRRFQSIFCQFDDGSASKRVVDRFFHGVAPVPPTSLHGDPAALDSWSDDRSG